MKELGLYVHVPYCKSKCKYCDFNSYMGCEKSMDEYFSCLCQEISNSASTFKDYTVTTVYIGGGTPSYVDAKYIQDVLSTIKAQYNLSEGAEISMEANPNSVTLDKAVIWYNAGVNRISIGLQAVSKKLLKTIGRIHTLKDYQNAIKILKLAGFTNINTDLMLGLPKQHVSDVCKAIKIAAKNSTHISAYSLIVEDGTPMKKLIEDGVLKLPSEEATIEMYDIAYDKLKKADFNRYEVSNFAKTGYECKHNLNCWSYLPYVGFGAGAHSFVENRRWENERNIYNYIDKMKKGDPATEKTLLTRDEQIEEYIMLGLRKEEGLCPKEMKQLFKYDLLKAKNKEIQKLSKAGLITVSDRISATEMGFFVLNRIILELT